MSYSAVPTGTFVKTPFGDAIVVSTSVNVNVSLITPHAGNHGVSVSEATLKELNPKLASPRYLPNGDLWPDPYQRRMDEWHNRLEAARGHFDALGR